MLSSAGSWSDAGTTRVVQRRGYSPGFRRASEGTSYWLLQLARGSAFADHTGRIDLSGSHLQLDCRSQRVDQYGDLFCCTRTDESPNANLVILDLP